MDLSGAGGLVLIREAGLQAADQGFLVSVPESPLGGPGSNPKQVIHDADHPTGRNRR
jgi:hypothetical protein